ncbi:MAG: hypothetical protein ABL907_16600, partial [Hyphomicrobium sp.]
PRPVKYYWHKVDEYRGSMANKRSSAKSVIRATVALSVLEAFTASLGAIILVPAHATKLQSGFVTSITVATDQSDQVIRAAIERRKSEYIIAIEEATELRPGGETTFTAKAAIVADREGHIVISGQSSGHRGAMFQRHCAEMIHRLLASASA